jgi:hypothetical protein
VVIAFLLLLFTFKPQKILKPSPQVFLLKNMYLTIQGVSLFPKQFAVVDQMPIAMGNNNWQVLVLCNFNYLIEIKLTGYQ